MKFSSFSLDDRILAALEEMGFADATEIQQQALPFLLEETDRDFIGLASTGTGKTAAFGLPLIQGANPAVRAPSGLVLSPTRELCLQIAGELERFSARIPGVSITAVYGGASIGEQISSLRRGSQIVVATPGRLADLIRRGKIDLSNLKELVLDEADIMLNMGFKEELDQILEATPSEKRVILLSATMPPEVARIAKTYMDTPHEVRVGTAGGGGASIEHLYAMCHSRDKFQALKRILDFNPDVYGIIFCRTKAAAQRIAEQLAAQGYLSSSLHGDLSQAQRDQVMAGFRDKSIRILVATDVAARGIDVDSVTHVIHYDLPDEAENYVHRSGRTGRAGRSGVSIALINMKEKGRLRQIERIAKAPIVHYPIPNGEEICRKQLLHLIDRVHQVQVDEEQIAAHMPIIEEKLAALDREELLKHFVSLEFNQFLSYYRNSSDINSSESGRDERGRGASRGKGERNYGRSRGDSSSREARGASSGRSSRKGNDAFGLLRINLGKKDRMNPGLIIALVNETSGMRDIEIGKINIEERSSTIMIDKEYVDLVKSRINSFHYRGRPVVATPEGPAGKKSSSKKGNYRSGGDDAGQNGRSGKSGRK